MTDTRTPTAPEIAVLHRQAETVRQVVAMNADGVSHEESLAQPRPGGNCMNWVLGHLVAVYNDSLPVVGQEPVMDPQTLARYKRGTPPVTGPNDDPLDFGELLEAWSTAAERHATGLAALTPDDLARPAPFGPDGAPKEGDTVGSLLTVIQFHQAYHAGQLGVLRRIAGKPGAIS